MDIKTLQERIEKKEKMIEKKRGTIDKKMALIEKKENKIAGYKNYSQWYKDTDENYKELVYTKQWLEDDVERLHSEIEEAEATLEKYRSQLAGEIEKEDQFLKEVPEQAKEMEKQLIEKWDESDKDRRKFYRDKAEELGYAEFVKKYKYNAWEYRYETDEQIHNRNVKDARTFVLDLLNRTKAITGEIESWAYVHLTVGTNGYPVLNGIVEGKEGRAMVESIYAGGYNIQRLHVRVLVKAC